ncbi:MAG: ligase-associated DNA damage response endonuclease PdeM [Pseudomonadota bacterium]
MDGYDFTFQGAALTALPCGALWWENEALLCVSDLHLGKSDRMARRGGPLLPPYENRDTLARLADVITKYRPRTVVCLGDSFDDLAGQEALDERDHAVLNRMMAGRRWIWIEGNHDPGPIHLGGTHLAEHRAGPLIFRHIATTGEPGEVSGHYHPKARVQLRTTGLTRPCFLIDQTRIILPAFGAYTGGLRTSAPVLSRLMGDPAIAVLTGAQALAVPMPRG